MKPGDARPRPRPDVRLINVKKAAKPNSAAPSTTRRWMAVEQPRSALPERRRGCPVKPAEKALLPAGDKGTDTTPNRAQSSPVVDHAQRVADAPRVDTAEPDAAAAAVVVGAQLVEHWLRCDAPSTARSAEKNSCFPLPTPTTPRVNKLVPHRNAGRCLDP
eukprot:6255442-Prymnesium_polylepis.2